MILEAIVTTLNADGSVNLAPMGPRVDASMEQFELKPFPSSTTCTNLLRERKGCLNITDDVMLYASAVAHQSMDVDYLDAREIEGKFLKSAARVYEFEVTWVDSSTPRVLMKCRSVAAHRQRDLFGFNRAKHAVLEASILLSRLDFLPRAHVEEQLRLLRSPVEKTGGERETEAFQLLESFFQRSEDSSCV